MRKIFITIALLFSTVHLYAQGGKNYGQFAPEDAYLNGAPFAYYGSENEWSRRMFSEKAAHRFYKRRGQRQLLAILDGKPEQAIEWCQKRLWENADDEESLFMLTVAFAQMGNLDKAMTLAKKAVAAGLPFARFLAGPRELLKPLIQSKMFQNWAKKYPIKFIHGPMLGCVTDSSARFWVRTVGEDDIVVRVFPKSTPDRVIECPVVQSSARRDYTTIARVSGLKPATEYFYDVLINDESAFPGIKPAFRTFPGSGSKAKFRIVFGGGAGYTPQHERIWDVIRQHRPDALLLLGDNVYIDMPEKPGAFHQYTYYRRQSRPEFRRLVSSTAVYAIWDDHDAAIDDVWLGPYLDKPKWKMPMLDFFKRQWNNPGYGGKDAPGVFFKFSIADVDFFMLDCRFYRTNPFAPEKTMLGPEQKTWLLHELKNSDATFKIIVSSVPWAPNTKPGSHDTWDGFPEEREEIFSFIEKNRIDGVFLMSADRHRSDVWLIKRSSGYPLYDLMSSKLTNIHTHDIVPGAVFSYNKKCSFGQLDFNTTRPDPQVVYKIYSIDNENVYSLTIKRSQLKVR